MEVISQRNQTRPYPKYLYHPDFNDPKIVNSQVEEAELGTKGWVTTYLFKAYPKWVGDKIVKSKEEEERLLAERKPLIEVVLDAIEQGPANNEVTPLDEMLDGGSGIVMPPVTKETQVDGQDTAVIEKPKKGPGRPKKT